MRNCMVGSFGLSIFWSSFQWEIEWLGVLDLVFFDQVSNEKLHGCELSILLFKVDQIVWRWSEVYDKLRTLWITGQSLTNLHANALSRNQLTISGLIMNRSSDSFVRVFLTQTRVLTLSSKLLHTESVVFLNDFKRLTFLN